MLERNRPCLDVATQLLAVDRGIVAARRAMIHDHMDHCLGTAKDGAGPHDLAEIMALARPL